MAGGRAIAAAVVLAFAASAAVAGAAQPPVLVSIAGTKETLSRKTVTVGPVVFEVANHGRRAATFGIAGKRTQPVRPGKTVVLRVTFRKPGAYPFAAPRPGVLRVVAAPSSAAVAVAAPTAGGSAPPPCANPVTATVNVTMTDVTGDSGYTFSPSTIPCGTVTFALTNTGNSPHALELMDPRGDVFASSAVVAPSATAGMTATLRYAGVYQWSDGDGLAGEAFETTTGWFKVT